MPKRKSRRRKRRELRRGNAKRIVTQNQKKSLMNHKLVKMSNNTFFATILLRKTYEMLIFYIAEDKHFISTLIIAANIC